MPEIIEHGMTGFLVDDVEGAVAAVDRIDTLDREAVSAAVSRNFSVERMTQDYLRLYRSILSKRE